MIVLAQLYGVVQLAAVGWAARSVRLGVLLTAVAAGAYGAAVASVALQWMWTRLYAALTGTAVPTVVAVASYTVDPVIEEVAKLLPVLLAWRQSAAVRRQWA